MAMSILAISGSPSRRLSRSSALLDYVGARLVQAGEDVHAIAVGDLPAEDLVGVRRDSPAALALHALVARSDALVIATPVYNASVPGGLKALLDLLPEGGLDGKSVLPLASGGSAGHQLAIEYSLKPVLSALGARHVLAGVFACEADVRWPLAGGAGPDLVSTLIDRLDDAAATLLASLAERRPRPVPATATVRDAAVDDGDAFVAPERCSA